uniref:FzdC n=1 Tax=Halisarca dujardinii TaxID=2583056 RepID=A0AAU8L1C2_HALDU
MNHFVTLLLVVAAYLVPDSLSAFSSKECYEVADRGFCQNTRYSNKSGFPNFRNGTSVSEIRQELDTYLLLYHTGCSNAIVDLLCSYYFPTCAEFESPVSSFKEVTIIPPCRELCNYVRETCEPELKRSQLIEKWPPHFECNIFPESGTDSTGLCYPGHGNLSLYQSLPLSTVPGVVLPLNVKVATQFWPGLITKRPTEPNVSVPTRPPQLAQCAPLLQVQNNSGDYRDYRLANYHQCGVPCSNDYFGTIDAAVPIVVLLFSILGIFSTVFIIATAAIERDRFHYPERPIVFLAVCYFFICLLFMVGSSSKLASSPIACSESNGALSSFVFQHLPQSDFSTITARSGGCVTVFFFLYWATMSSFLWFDILTFTWFLAATLKWAEEAISKFWLLYHFIAWGIPLFQVIIAMAIQLVDGDKHSGVCFLGNSNSVGLGVFVFLPMVVYLLVGMVFLLVGFISLINIYMELARDHQKSRHLIRLIVRVSIFSCLYLVPNIILVIMYMYELAIMNNWQVAVLCHENNPSAAVECSEQAFYSLPSKATASAIKYVVWIIVAFNISFWVFTKKTYLAWKQLFTDLVPCIKRHVGSAYDIKHPTSSQNKL